MRVAIFGAAGAIGHAVYGALVGRSGGRLRVVGRSVDKLQAFADAEVVAADLSRESDVARAAEGMDAIVYTLGLPYSARAFAAYPAMMRACVEAARTAGVSKLVLITNVYPYGLPQTPRVTEEHPRQPVGAKARYRKEQEDILLAAHGPKLRTLSLRLPDFYGPHTANGLMNSAFEAARDGKAAHLLGPIDVPHEFMFTPDVGPVVADLLERDAAFGSGYNLAGAGVITQREFAERVFRAFGREPAPLRVAGPFLQRALGVVMPVLRELREVDYLLSKPVLLDDRKLHQVLPDLVKTSYDTGIERTAEWMRHSHSANATASRAATA